VRDHFVSNVPWSADRPRVLVVCCSDGRFHGPITDFVDHEVSDRADLVALPGGPAVVDPWNSSFDEARVFASSLALFEAHHELREAWLLAHEGCSYYRLRHPTATPAELEARQIADLRRAATLLRERASRLDVRLVFVRVVADRVTFTTVVDDRTESDESRARS
jgi:hypothetical protein